MRAETFKHLKVGDRVTRLLSDLPMQLVVVAVESDLVTCSLHAGVTDPGSCWTFDALTGVEIDEEIGWGPAFGRTGSRLQRVSDKTN